MKSKNDFFWSMSLIIIGIATILLAGPASIRESLPDTVVRIIGIIDLLMLPVLVVTSINKAKKK